MSFNRPSYVNAGKTKDSNIFWKKKEETKSFGSSIMISRH